MLKTNNVWRGFGFIYFLVNAMLLTVFSIFSFYAMLKGSPAGVGWPLFFFPAVGIFAGYWIRHGKYGWWRIFIIVLSLMVSVLGVLGAIFVLPQIKQINEMHQKHAAELKQMDAQVETFIDAVHEKDLAAIEKALKEGVYINAKNRAGQTALHATQDEEILKFLIEQGADVNARDDMQMTPIFNKEVPLARMLVNAGADIHAKSEKGNTPLMWYAYSGYLEGVQYMLSLGADSQAVNADGQNAANIAERFGHVELLEYLR